jgi:hypothetical protein
MSDIPEVVNKAWQTVVARLLESTNILASLEKDFRTGPVLIPGILVKNMKVNGKKA